MCKALVYKHSLLTSNEINYDTNIVNMDIILSSADQSELKDEHKVDVTYKNLILDNQINRTGSANTHLVHTTPTSSPSSDTTDNHDSRDGKAGKIQSVHNFKIGGINHIVLILNKNIIQLFREQIAKQKINKKSFKVFELTKEWKHVNDHSEDIMMDTSFSNPNDEIVKIGVIQNKYLYSCSPSGKLIVRDLINDDSKFAYKVYWVGQVSSMCVWDKYPGVINIATVTDHNDLKLYEIELDVKLEADRNHRHMSQLPENGEHPTYVPIYDFLHPPARQLRRVFTSLNVILDPSAVNHHNYPNIESRSPDNEASWRAYANSINNRIIRINNPNPNSGNRTNNTSTTIPVSNVNVGSTSARSRSSQSILMPIWGSELADHNSKGARFSNWIVSILLFESVIICGTQFGVLSCFDTTTGNYGAPSSVTKLKVSIFPLINLVKINSNHFLFTDSLSKVGIVKVLPSKALEIVNFYDNLQIGPMSKFECILPVQMKQTQERPVKLKPSATYSSPLEFKSPIYLVSSTLQNTIMIHKLFPHNTWELVLDLPTPALVPDFSILNNNYHAFQSIFGHTERHLHDRPQRSTDNSDKLLDESNTHEEDYERGKISKRAKYA
ncbi:uncharacterized protein RJT21DRAFT_111723 [Scheffersomyces amazonensis]|uniref:uncharacterized protein n=1 Tax=Scheffersomyces amazonensis TaxID=1078765 RepID=UPI00315D96DD